MTEKEIKETSLKIEHLKKDIQDLNAKKVLLIKGSEERKKLLKKIKSKEKKVIRLTNRINRAIRKNLILSKNNTLEPDKEKIIKEILRIEKERKTIPTFKTLGINLHKYTIENLKIHLKKLNTKKGVK